MSKGKDENEVFEEDFNILDGLGNPEDFLPLSKDVDNKSVDVEGDEDDEDKNVENDPEKDSDNEDDTEKQESDEDEETEENDLIESKEKEDADSDDKNSSPLTPYAKYLKEEGILPNLDIETFDGTVDGLKQSMYNEIIQGVEEYKSSLPDTLKTLINNYEEGVPLSTLLEINDNSVKYNSITDEELEDESVQKQIMTEYLSKTTKFSKEKIQKQVERLADLQELDSEARGALQDLIELQKQEEQDAVEKAVKQQEEAEKVRVQQVKELQETIKTTKEIIPGIDVPQNIKDKIFKNLTTAVAYDVNNNPINKLGVYRSKNPMQAEIMLNYLFEATNQFTDFSVFGKAAKKTIISDIEKAARSFDNKSTGRTANSKTGSAKNFMEAIDKIDW